MDENETELTDGELVQKLEKLCEAMEVLSADPFQLKRFTSDRRKEVIGALQQIATDFDRTPDANRDASAIVGVMNKVDGGYLSGDQAAAQIRIFLGTGSIDPQELTASAPRAGTVNERMLAKLQSDPDDVLEWSAGKWADSLGCAKSTVVETQAWKSITTLRDLRKAERTGR